MLLVSTTLKPGGIQGLGCFTTEAIKKGQAIWVLDERMDLVMPESELSDLPLAVQGFLRIYSYTCMLGGERVMVLCGDHSKHMNHSDDPNCLNCDDAATPRWRRGTSPRARS
ncbi:MAG: SET domain-containing protein [Chloroflexota bacterium]